MFYKQIKYLAANRILSLLKKECKIYTAIGTEELYLPSYLWTELDYLHQKARCYKIDTLRDAVLMLKESNEVMIKDNTNHIYKIKVGITNEGEKACKERTYVWRFIISIKGLLIGIISLITALIILLNKLR